MIKHFLDLLVLILEWATCGILPFFSVCVLKVWQKACPQHNGRFAGPATMTSMRAPHGTRPGSQVHMPCLEYGLQYILWTLIWFIFSSLSLIPGIGFWGKSWHDHDCGGHWGGKGDPGRLEWKYFLLPFIDHALEVVQTVSKVGEER